MMDCLYIFLFMLHFSAGCDLVGYRQTVEVTGYSGESVVLPCSCTKPLTKSEQIQWKYFTGNDFKEIYPSDHTERYKNRVKLLNQNTPGNLSLLLSSLTKEDQGNYRCSVSHDNYTDIRLHVKGCDLVQNKQTVVVTGYSGESVVLPCSCTEPLTKPEQIQWKYYTDHDYKEIYPSDHTERYKNRVKLLNQTTPGNLSLLLSSLTKEDQGDYLCSVSHDEYMFIELHVKGCDVVGYKQTVVVTGYSGESVVLPCSCTELRAKPEQIQWMYYTGNDFKEIYPSDHTERYMKRVKLLNQNTPGNLSLLLSSLTIEDYGNYRCLVSHDKYTDIKLYVKESPHSSTSQPVQQTHEHTSKDQTKDQLTHKRMDPYVILIVVFASVLLLALLAFIYWRFKGSKNVKEKNVKMNHVKVTCDDPEPARENEDEVTYSAVVHVKHSSTPASTHDKVEYTEYACVNVKRT